MTPYGLHLQTGVYLSVCSLRRLSFLVVWLLEETTFLTHCLIQLCYKQAIQYQICLDYLGVKKKHLEGFSL